MFKEMQSFHLNDPIIDGDEIITSIVAKVCDMRNKAIVDAVVDAAQRAGITELYLLDKTFILEAIREKLSASDWIPVAERLPEEHQYVLVWAEYHEEGGWSWGLEEIDSYCEACGWDNTADAEAREVTHWRPMHEPPKGVIE